MRRNKGGHAMTFGGDGVMLQNSWGPSYPVYNNPFCFLNEFGAWFEYERLKTFENIPPHRIMFYMYLYSQTTNTDQADRGSLLGACLTWPITDTPELRAVAQEFQVVPPPVVPLQPARKKDV